jgi:hypothetical protein
MPFLDPDNIECSVMKEIDIDNIISDTTIDTDINTNIDNIDEFDLIKNIIETSLKEMLIIRKNITQFIKEKDFNQVKDYQQIYQIKRDNLINYIETIKNKISNEIINHCENILYD